ncbi:uncharacterized protein FA14DRAFT_54704 [Meira miltonrushii]|uniref:Uncharacterized protein n=1 Tax=Meira miltonrushii TaxID=1280837 RepID=A0A316VFT7_9BASI|nr:uncharacterized protein FA14DRAFT_54704 [Meira miltonrushii]PWN36386.1 hypothetical protein FA14DRAFT_54704 [Meira miltonrushii]
MDLTNLRDSLDSSSRERHPARASAKKSELRLTKDFKAAALQLTTLYRTSLSASNRSYATGYAQSLSDILDVVLLRLQQPAATAPGFQRGESSNSQGDTDREELKWLVRYLRARIEAIRVEGEEEEKEESEEEDVAEIVRSSQPVSPEATRTSIDEAVQTNQQQQAASQDSSMQGSQHDAPTRSNFTFSAPQDSAPSLSTANRMRRGRESGGSMPRPPSNTVHQQQGSTLLTPPTMVRASSSDDEDNMRQRTPTPSRRQSNRLGKRLNGREKLSGLELFARAQNVKRRRGLGDRRDDDDGLL